MVGEMATVEDFLRHIVLNSDGRSTMLRAVAALDLPDAWIAAGAVRNAVWDSLHSYTHSTPLTDVDVIWFDPDNATPDRDRALEATLSDQLPGVCWSVKNQARMHRRNGHLGYLNCLDAMRYWPETATAVAIRLGPNDTFQCQAAFGYADLFGLVLRPTRPDAPFAERVRSKGWLTTWPKLRIESHRTESDAEPAPL
jgi:hypothetical protein